ncbi:hypothetical protein TrRE_jg12226 [Triparma retinervis]|uniref:Uncharacterized protein n=1 Tax=Triparma retinervis TaxID=2557542 RepID=A0A9W6Z8U6_9STRA|nr:hypothetical protein TrRE_jg12226 [Triparma retinervis]
MPVQSLWVRSACVRYGFSGCSEVVRHLVFCVNGEGREVKRLVFKIKRCLHCHVGARQGQHAKEVLGGVEVYEFQMAWLGAVVGACPVRSADKAVRCVCDFYMSRINEARIAVEQGKENGGVTGDDVERELFTRRREHDSRVEVALERWEKRGVEEGEKEPVQILSDEAQGMVGACSPLETAAAIKRCQVGRGSASYASSLGETAEETERRRKEERKEEDKEEFKQQKELIRKTLGSVMG